MKNLIVLAHPNKESFNAAIAKKFEKQLKNKGEEVVVRDLYELGFDPVMTWDEMNELRNGSIKEDVQIEQTFVKECDNIIFVYPIWWTSMPAILKGYIDRVFSYGFAYVFNEEGGIDGLFKGKSVTVVNTYGTPKEYYDASGMSEAFHKTTDVGIFEFCGMNVKQHLYLGEVPYINEEQGSAILEKISY